MLTTPAGCATPSGETFVLPSSCFENRDIHTSATEHLICATAMTSECSVAQIYAGNWLSEDVGNISTPVESDYTLRDSDVAPDPYFPFIYDKDWNYNWLGDELAAIIATLDPGYMYVADWGAHSVIQVLDVPVTDYECNLGYIFALTKSNQIVRVDYTGNNRTVIYNGVSGDLAALEYENFALYFADGDNITRINTQSGNTEIVLSISNIVYIFPYKVGKLLLRDTYGNAYTYDENTRKLILLEDENAVDELLNSTIASVSPTSQNRLQANTNIVASTSTTATSPRTLPLSEYPIGSYFTTTGNACTNHSYCKTYACTNQCDGFARYVNEHYYHVAGSTWSAPYAVAGDLESPYNRYQAFGSTTALYQFFNQLEKGAYVRVSRRNAIEDSTPPHTSQGSHSFVYIYHNNNGAILYEANLDNECGVSYGYRSFDELLSRYPYFFGWVNHDQNGIVINSSDYYHKIRCSHSGCTAFIEEKHSYRYISGRYVCGVCGDSTLNPIGNIVSGYQ